MDLLKKVLYAGVGGLAYGYEMGTALIEEMVKKGEITITQGQALNEELKKSLKQVKASAEETVSVSKAEYERLKARVAELEGSELE
ncbi:MAG: phasin family protein [Erysipelotrichaceae bacterium]